MNLDKHLVLTLILLLSSCSSSSDTKFSYSEILELEKFSQGNPSAQNSPTPTRQPALASSPSMNFKPIPPLGTKLTLKQDCFAQVSEDLNSAKLNRIKAGKSLWVTPADTLSWVTIQRKSGPAVMSRSCF